MTAQTALQISGLETVLTRARADSFEFPYLLANHVPMVLVALDRLGASPQRLDEWYEIYKDAHKLPPMPEPVAPFSVETWQSSLGDRSREADYRAFFTDEVRRLGIAGAIRTYISPMAQGIGGSATHPLMRLAYAVLNVDPDEVGNAIGYWAATYLPLLGPTGAMPETDDPAVLLGQMDKVAGIHDIAPETDLLWHTIKAVGALDDFAPVVDRLAFTPATPRKMAEASLIAFTALLDFTSLHAVTGLHWLRVVSPYLGDWVPVYRAYWQVLLALVPKLGFPALPSADWIAEQRARPAPEWPDIKAKAIASNDEHDISLTYSASEEEKVWGDPLYRVVAARRVGLID